MGLRRLFLRLSLLLGLLLVAGFRRGRALLGLVLGSGFVLVGAALLLVLFGDLCALWDGLVGFPQRERNDALSVARIASNRDRLFVAKELRASAYLPCAHLTLSAAVLVRLIFDLLRHLFAELGVGRLSFAGRHCGIEDARLVSVR